MIPVVPIVATPIVTVMTVVTPIIIMILIIVIFIIIVIAVALFKNWRSGSQNSPTDDSPIGSAGRNCILELAKQTPGSDLVGRTVTDGFFCKNSSAAG